MKIKKHIVTGLLITSLLSVGVTSAVQAFSLGDILKGGGVAVLVSQFSTPLNNFINTLTLKHGAGTDYATKVVPIITVGGGTYVGAAQVTGDQYLIDQTKAVLQVEAAFGGNQFRVKSLIPIDSDNPINFSRVQGVGVSALIDVRI